MRWHGAYLINEFNSRINLNSFDSEATAWVLYFSWIEHENRNPTELVSWILDRYSNRYEFSKLNMNWIEYKKEKEFQRNSWSLGRIWEAAQLTAKPACRPLGQPS
jgi:hypothetical protein